MDRIWAPWREHYITCEAHKTKGCVFCRIHKEKKDKERFIFSRSKHCFAVLNLYPYNNGHTLIVPYRHIADPRKLSTEERADFWELMYHCQDLLEEALSPQGFNVGMNIGKVAGAGVPGHVHIHIVPRWGGDVNFMPIVNNTRVISQSMTALFKRLKTLETKKIKSRKPKTTVRKKK